MHARWIPLLLLGAAALPLALAHEPAGTPKDYCESVAEWNVHDYGAPASGRLVAGGEDGNLLGDCDGVTSVDPGTPCAGFDDPANPLTFYAGFCDSEVNLPVADFDGHREWALGGAWLLSCDAACGASGAGAGAYECFGEPAHHGSSVSVVDLGLGAGATFSVAADHVDAAAVAAGLPESACGDFEDDQSQECLGSCGVVFPPGLDGAYTVYVQGGAGHVIGDGGGPGVPGGDGITLGSGGTMVFDGSGGPPAVKPAPGWFCEGPYEDGDDWLIRCRPILFGARMNPVACTNPYAVAGGTPVSYGNARVSVWCRDTHSSGCTTAWSIVGGCVAPPLLLVDAFPLHCRAQATGTSAGGTLFAACGTLY